MSPKNKDRLIGLGVVLIVTIVFSLGLWGIMHYATTKS